MQQKLTTTTTAHSGQKRRKRMRKGRGGRGEKVSLFWIWQPSKGRTSTLVKNKKVLLSFFSFSSPSLLFLQSPFVISCCLSSAAQDLHRQLTIHSCCCWQRTEQREMFDRCKSIKWSFSQSLDRALVSSLSYWRALSMSFLLLPLGNWHLLRRVTVCNGVYFGCSCFVFYFKKLTFLGGKGFMRE